MKNIIRVKAGEKLKNGDACILRDDGKAYAIREEEPFILADRDYKESEMI